MNLALPIFLGAAIISTSAFAEVCPAPSDIREAVATVFWSVDEGEEHIDQLDYDSWRRVIGYYHEDQNAMTDVECIYYNDQKNDEAVQLNFSGKASRFSVVDNPGFWDANGEYKLCNDDRSSCSWTNV